MTQTTTGSSVGPIIFSDTVARQQLQNDGEVVTFRKSNRTTGKTWWRKSRLGTKEGDVTVEKVKEVDPRDSTQLEPYQDLSGFQTVTKWQQAIRSLHGNLPQSGHLYRVTERTD